MDEPVIDLHKKSVAMKAPAETSNAETENRFDDQCTRLTGKIKRALDQKDSEDHFVFNMFLRIPDVHRKVNEEAFTPQVISIGPFHHRSPKLQPMEKYKLRCLQRFMKRAKMELKDLVGTVLANEEYFRAFYEGTIDIESDDFIKMILVDACFIIEFFLKDLSQLRKWTHEDAVELKPWLVSRMKLDLILLENQLPFIIIERLYEELPESGKYRSSFLGLALDFFSDRNFQNITHVEMDRHGVIHFLDLLRHFNLPNHQDAQLQPVHIQRRRNGNVVRKMYCASQLAEAGLKFKPVDNGSLVDIRFGFKEGVLEIPRFPLNNITEIYARNIMAWEQCAYPAEAYVTDYFIMLDLLINTSKDVDLLVKQGILVNQMDTGNIKLPLPGNLCAGISHWGICDDYVDICNALVNFRKRHWYVILKTSLRKDYFRTPWMGAATIGAIFLLILTLIQTVCTVISIFM